MRKFNWVKFIDSLLMILISAFFPIYIYDAVKGSIDFILVYILAIILLSLFILKGNIDEIKKMLYKDRGE